MIDRLLLYFLTFVKHPGFIPEIPKVLPEALGYLFVLFSPRIYRQTTHPISPSRLKDRRLFSVPAIVSAHFAELETGERVRSSVSAGPVAGGRLEHEARYARNISRPLDAERPIEVVLRGGRRVNSLPFYFKREHLANQSCCGIDSLSILVGLVIGVLATRSVVSNSRSMFAVAPSFLRNLSPLVPPYCNYSAFFCRILFSQGLHGV